MWLRIRLQFKINPEWLIELDKCANRDTAPAFFEGTPGYEEQMFGQQQSKNHHLILWFGIRL